MSMDAANYISTLELIAPRTTTPESYDFAILDLASEETLLEQIYSGMVSESIEWWSLFEGTSRSEEHTSELQSRPHLVCRLLLEKKKKRKNSEIQTDSSN